LYFKPNKLPRPAKVDPVMIFGVFYVHGEDGMMDSMAIVLGDVQ
jgi:hypothetical protein